MEQDVTSIHLLLAHADDHRPALESGLPRDEAATGPRPDERLPPHMFDPDRDPASLVEQRWGVIAPEGPAGDRLLAITRPLLQLRQEQQGGSAVKVYRVPAGMTADDVIRWRNSVYLDEGTPEEDRPRYLLILGDLDQVSLEVQQLIASGTLIGRIAFREERGYAAYVDKVLRWEKVTLADEPRAVFCTIRDGTPATNVGHRALMAPTFEQLLRKHERGDFRVKELVPIESADGTATKLLQAIADRHPTMLFSISHGLGAPRSGWRSAEQQWALQGAMSLGDGEHLSAGDVAERPFLPGGIWFYLACYGAGTPADSAYRHWLTELREAGKFRGQLEPLLSGLPKPGDRPFIASLPQAALANPEGPLSIIAHVDLAWTYSFQDVGEGARSRSSRFQGIFQSIVDGGRAGMAHRRLLRYLDNANTDLATRYGQEESARASGGLSGASSRDPMRIVEKAHLWMLRQDLAAYIVLGDPAARLAVRGKVTSKAPVTSAARLLGIEPLPSRPASGGRPPSPKPPSPERTPEPPAAPVVPAAPAVPATSAATVVVAAPARSAEDHDLDSMEDAVWDAIRGEMPTNQILRKYGVGRRELERWERIYKEAGRAALARLRGG